MAMLVHEDFQYINTFLAGGKIPRTNLRDSSANFMTPTINLPTSKKGHPKPGGLCTIQI
jgi:hypothetical protein